MHTLYKCIHYTNACVQILQYKCIMCFLADYGIGDLRSLRGRILSIEQCYNQLRAHDAFILYNLYTCIRTVYVYILYGFVLFLFFILISFYYEM